MTCISGQDDRLTLPKHATASTFVFKSEPAPSRETPTQLLLLWHAKFDRWMIPGGHVEENENCAEAAAREVREETELEIRLLSEPGAALAVDRSVLVHRPWAIVEQRIPSRAGEPEHVHIDHLFVAVPINEREPSGGASWFTMGELDQLEMFHDTRQMAKSLATAPAPTPTGT